MPPALPGASYPPEITWFAGGLPRWMGKLRNAGHLGSVVRRLVASGGGNREQGVDRGMWQS